MSFGFDSTSGQWARSAEDWTSALSEFQQHPFCNFLSLTPCGLSSLIQYHFFPEPGPMNDHCPFPNLFACRETSVAFATHCSSLTFVPQMSLNIDINRILPVKISGVSFNLNSKRLTSSLSCNVLYPGKYSTRIPLARRRCCQSFCNFEKIWSILIFAPIHR